MLEVLICSLVTVFPDYLIRRLVQGKRIGHEITLFSVWYELRWGITLCILLTLLLITTIFYFHPSTTSATTYFRTIPIIPEINGRVSDVYVGMTDKVKAGQPIFKLDSTLREAAVETATRQVAEADAAIAVAQSDIAAAEGQVVQAQNALKQYTDDLRTKKELFDKKSGTVAAREIEKLQTSVAAGEGQVSAALAARDSAVSRATVLLPAQKASAAAKLTEAKAELERTVIRAGVDGQLEQFILRVGDIVNPMVRPAGVLVPEGAGKKRLFAGFNQIESGVMKPGMMAEAACMSKPMEIIPLVVVDVQDFIAVGQARTGEQLIDAQQVQRPGTLLVALEPLYEGGLDGLMPGSSCIVNAYSEFHDDTAAGIKALALHAVNALGLVHAILLRMQAIMLPVKTLVLSGH